MLGRIVFVFLCSVFSDLVDSLFGDDRTEVDAWYLNNTAHIEVDVPISNTPVKCEIFIGETQGDCGISSIILPENSNLCTYGDIIDTMFNPYRHGWLTMKKPSKEQEESWLDLRACHTFYPFGASKYSLELFERYRKNPSKIHTNGGSNYESGDEYTNSGIMKELEQMRINLHLGLPLNNTILPGQVKKVFIRIGDKFKTKIFTIKKRTESVKNKSMLEIMGLEVLNLKEHFRNVLDVVRKYDIPEDNIMNSIERYGYDRSEFKGKGISKQSKEKGSVDLRSDFKGDLARDLDKDRAPDRKERDKDGILDSKERDKDGILDKKERDKDGILDKKERDEDVTPDKKEGMPPAVQWGLIGGGAVLAVILVVIACYFIRRKRRGAN